MLAFAWAQPRFWGAEAQVRGSRPNLAQPDRSPAALARRPLGAG